jgi:hypothetical protein
MMFAIFFNGIPDVTKHPPDYELRSTQQLAASGLQ